MKQPKCPRCRIAFDNCRTFDEVKQHLAGCVPSFFPTPQLEARFRILWELVRATDKEGAISIPFPKTAGSEFQRANFESFVRSPQPLPPGVEAEDMRSSIARNASMFPFNPAFPAMPAVAGMYSMPMIPTHSFMPYARPMLQMPMYPQMFVQPYVSSEVMPATTAIKSEPMDASYDGIRFGNNRPGPRLIYSDNSAFGFRSSNGHLTTLAAEGLAELAEESSRKKKKAITKARGKGKKTKAARTPAKRKTPKKRHSKKDSSQSDEEDDDDEEDRDDSQATESAADSVTETDSEDDYVSKKRKKATAKAKKPQTAKRSKSASAKSK